ncbi:hypothetical protein STCU_04266 [Strigomonas culicis]|nr:hypothetical protein STCU_04266 [Strigomonas culicis]|eukprot:EPY30040.1 hypothetical protein STCU_04266 [Strigomonas culicis]
MWHAYANNDLALNKFSLDAVLEPPEQIIVDFGSRKLCVMATGGRALLALLSSDSEEMKTEMGMLKLKTSMLHHRVDPLLRPVMTM